MGLGHVMLACPAIVVVLVLSTLTDATLPSECSLPAEVGWCRAAMPRYFYNTQTMGCEFFIYGGCNGNDNNFLTLSACQQRCMSNNNNNNNNNQLYIYNHTDICQRPFEAGMFCTRSSPRYYYNTAQKACVLVPNVEGCPVEGNSFMTQADCQEACSSRNTMDFGNYDNSDPCMYPPETGPCRGYTVNFYYNRHTGQCSSFVYGLCGGNENRFNSLSSCQARCGGAPVIGGSYPAGTPVFAPSLPFFL